MVQMVRFMLGVLLLSSFSLGATSGEREFFLRNQKDQELQGPYILADHQYVLEETYRLRVEASKRFGLVENRSGGDTVAEGVAFENGSTFQVNGERYQVVAGKEYERIKKLQDDEFATRKRRRTHQVALEWGMEQVAEIETDLSDMEALVQSFEVRINLLDRSLAAYPEAPNREEAETFLAQLRELKDYHTREMSVGNVYFRGEWMTKEEKAERIRREHLWERYGLYMEFEDRTEAREFAKRIKDALESGEKIEEESIRTSLRRTAGLIGEEVDLTGRVLEKAVYRRDPKYNVHFVSFEFSEEE